MNDANPVASHPLTVQVGNLPPTEAVSALVEHACNMRLSDLFFTTEEGNVGVAGRHLGVMQLLSRLTADHGRRCISHIKAMANMDMTERRRPLDGRWVFHRGDDTVDLRINSLPTLYGEDLTLRILDRQTRTLALDTLGMLPHGYNQLLGWLNNPSGLLLVTGPTGAGKTTTLYACLGHLNNGQRKLNTIEDPVEYAVAGVRQSQVNAAVDVGFAELLRSVLRQAPDVIMVGEIRDPETAETAVRAANSGHLVLATLHAPVAAGAIQSMLSLGVHPHFLASSLIGVVAQRLIRVLCNECKEAFDVTDAPHTFDEVRKWLEPGQGERLYNPKGCAACRGLGFVDRTGVFELLPVSRAIRRLIMERQPMQVIRQKAIEEGMIEFRLSALLKMARGDTSFAEVFRAIPSEYLVLE